MKLLFVNKELPYPPAGGGKIRVYSLLKHLAERHEVNLIAFSHEPDPSAQVAALKAFCANVVAVPVEPQQLRLNKRKQQLRSIISTMPYQRIAHYSPAMQQAIDQFVARHPVDALTIEYAQMAYYRLPKHVPCVLDQHNVENEIFYRTFRNDTVSLRKLYSFLEWRKFTRDEIKACRSFPLVLTTSERDRKVLQGYAPQTEFAVVPNGVDGEYFQNNAQSTTEDTILFTGTIDYYPNTDGLLFFLDDILPLVRERRPNARFVIVGKNPPPQIARYTSDPQIVVTGFVDDVRTYFEQASVFVTPLRVGGGTRLKILEALAMRKAVVATSIGAEGINVTHGRDILLADQPRAFADAVVTLLEDQALRDRLGAAGRQLIEQRYDWRLVVRTLEQAYEQLRARQEKTRSTTNSVAAVGDVR